MGRRASGFSVLEVLITTAIVSVALLGLASLFPTGYQNIVYGGGRQTAGLPGQRGATHRGELAAGGPAPARAYPSHAVELHK